MTIINLEKFLKSSRKCKVLNFSRQEITDNDCFEVVKLIRKCKYIEEINLSDNYIEDNGAIVIVLNALHVIKSLKILNLERNYIKQNTAEFLINLIPSNIINVNNQQSNIIVTKLMRSLKIC